MRERARQPDERAVRLGVAIAVLVLRDNKYGVIQHHMDRHLGRHFGIDFGNPDLVAYATSFGMRARRIENRVHGRPCVE